MLYAHYRLMYMMTRATNDEREFTKDLRVIKYLTFVVNNIYLKF
jgi:hypothetical protein